MFTGIIERLGKIEELKPCKMGRKILVKSTFDMNDISIGASIAINGVCLTVTEIKGHYFSADVSPETVNKTTFKWIRIGDFLNLEKALKLSERLNGHLVSGHVDGIGFLKKKVSLGNAIIMVFKIPMMLSKYVIVKGSIAIDGISLTVNKCDEGMLSVSVIPHTFKITTLSKKKLGDRVNVETDIVGKYIEQFVNNNHNPINSKRTGMQSRNNIDVTYLSKNGFIY